jgi:ankyrin repeat protein
VRKGGIKYLVSCGVNVAKGVNMSDELVDAAEHGNLQRVKQLLNGGADIHYDEDNAIYYAAINDRLDVVKYLVTQGADIHVGNEITLRSCARDGQSEMVEYLISQGADVSAHDNSSLISAARKGHLEIIQLLMNAGADTHAREDWIFKNCSDEVIYHIKLLENNNSVSDDRWNATCPSCESKAYRGFNSFECSKGC